MVTDRDYLLPKDLAYNVWRCRAFPRDGNPFFESWMRCRFGPPSPDGTYIVFPKLDWERETDIIRECLDALPDPDSLPAEQRDALYPDPLTPESARAVLEHVARARLTVQMYCTWAAEQN